MWDLHNLALEHAGAHAGSGPWDDDLSAIRETYLEGGGEFLVGVEGRRSSLWVRSVDATPAAPS